MVIDVYGTSKWRECKVWQRDKANYNLKLCGYVGGETRNTVITGRKGMGKEKIMLPKVRTVRAY